jgi:hypothetical protein
MGYYRRGIGGLSRMGQAISTAEGFGPSGNVPTIANNPGDLELGDIGYGVTQAAGGQQITNFPTLEAGEAALENQINLIATGTSKAGYTPSMSIAQVGQLYSGGSSAWANNVAAALGVSPDTNFASLIDGALASTSASVTAPADASLDTSGSSISDLLAGLVPSTDTAPYIVGGLVVVAALAYALS